MPTITSFSPPMAAPGQLVTIIGSGFTGATSVKFGGVNALTFLIVSDTQIEAWPDITGTGTVSVTTGSGTATVSGFTSIVVKVKMPDAPVLGRVMNDTDLLWIWDSIRNVLTKATIADLPSTGGSSGPPGTIGNVYTALGSPFKVRSTDSNLEFIDPDTIISDVRLVGKIDYVVYATDLNAEFENYSDFLTETNTGSTASADGTYSSQSAINNTGSGTGAEWDIIIVSSVVQSAKVTVPGSGYLVGDTFHFASLPGIIFTIDTVGDGSGNLIYNDIEGTVTIKNYELTPGKHITIYADGVPDTSANSVTGKMATYDKVLAPILASLGSLGKSGIVWPWRLPAFAIPSGWQPCTDFEGKVLIGQDPTDVYDATTNPDGLSQGLNSIVGNKYHTNIIEEMAPHHHTMNATNANVRGSNALSYPYTANAKSVTDDEGGVDIGGGVFEAKPYSILNPARIVNWIEYIG